MGFVNCQLVLSLFCRMRRIEWVFIICVDSVIGDTDKALLLSELSFSDPG